MTKVALLFRGQPRFLENNKSFFSHKNWIIDKYETDIYCHVWWSNNKIMSSSTWSNISTTTFQENDIEYIKKNYNPKKIIVEEPKHFKLSLEEESNISIKHANNIEQLKNIQNCISQMYSSEMVSLLVDDNLIKNYDYIIFSRLDNVIQKIPDLNILEPEYFYLSNLHPRFPDNLYIFNPKYLPMLRTYTDFYNLAISSDYLVAESIYQSSYKKYFNFKDCRQTDDIRTFFLRNL